MERDAVKQLQTIKELSDNREIKALTQVLIEYLENKIVMGFSRDAKDGN